MLLLVILILILPGRIKSRIKIMSKS
jgi:hypothetical protein